MFHSLACPFLLVFLPVNCVFAQKQISTLQFNATALFGKDHRFPELINNITAIKVFENEPVRGLIPLPEFRLASDYEPDFSVIKNHFIEGLSFERHWMKAKLKRKAQDYITSTLVHILGNGSVSLQPFKLSGQSFGVLEGNVDLNGTNIVGVIKGARYGQKDDVAFVLGAHWDTVRKCPGVDDNGSGVVTVLEMARLLKAKSKREKMVFTFYFVLFDMEELGMIGSYVYVATSIVPQLVAGNFSVYGTYIFDMVLNYNSLNNTQSFVSGEEKLFDTNPTATKEIVDKGSKGDFISVMTRKSHDDTILSAIDRGFKYHTPKIPLKLYYFQAPLPKTFSEYRTAINRNYSRFYRGDHWRFWYPFYANKTAKNVRHGHETAYNGTIQTAFFVDTGKLRGIQRKCYHLDCDNTSQLNDENLHFLSSIVITAYISIDILMKEYRSAPNQVDYISDIILFLATIVIIIFIIYFIHTCIFKLSKHL